MSFRGRKRSAVTLASAAVSVALLAGCGGGKDFADNPRPAAPVQLNGVINKDGVQISPAHIGAGPVQILVSNQTGAPHTLELNGSKIASVTTDPIGAGNTGQIQATLEQGVYTVKAGSAHAVVKELKPARLVIGPERADSNNQVGLP
jgi:hypothetical protein